VFEIGNSLREARTRKGLSIRDAEEATKIRTKYLQALEEDDFDAIPGPAYVIGFLRTYAQYLELDSAALIGEYKSQFQPRFLEGHTLPKNRPSGRPGRMTSRRRPNYVVVGVVALIIILVLAWIGWGNRGQGRTEIEPDPSITATVTTAAAPTDGQGEAGEDNSSEGTTSSVAAGVPVEGPIDVTIRAVNDRCYLIVRDTNAGGRTLFSDTLDQGQEVEVSAERQLWMNIANPKALVLIINGAEFTVPEPYGEFLVTAAGIARIAEQ
jgi:cytoskeletal protein RodZ